MNKRQVIILWAIAIALGAAVATVKLSQQKSNHSATSRSGRQTLFESFPAKDIAAVEIQGAENQVALAKKDGKWVVTQRDNYPANSAFVYEFLRTLGELKVTLGMEAGPSFAPRFGMDESSKVPADRGLTATLKDASGKEIAKVSLGKSIESNADSQMGGGNAVGRYVRNHADSSGFYAVSEMFPSISPEPARWLADSFISPEKIKSISVSMPDKKDAAWQLTRESEDAEFKLTGAAATETLNTTTTAPFKGLFSYARFEDVVPKEKIAPRAAAEGKLTAMIDTFEGFSYEISLTPTKPAPAPAPANAAMSPPPVADNFLMEVTVQAELPKERKKAQDEKPEDAKQKDAAFTERLKSLTEKLQQEKALAGRTFEVAKSLVEPLLLNRASLIAVATPPPAAGGDNVQMLPGGMIAKPPGSSATSPPVSIPAGGKE